MSGVQRECELDARVSNADQPPISVLSVGTADNGVIRGVERTTGVIDPDNPNVAVKISRHSQDDIWVEHLLCLDRRHASFWKRHSYLQILTWKIQFDQVVGVCLPQLVQGCVEGVAVCSGPHPLECDERREVRQLFVSDVVCIGACDQRGQPRCPLGFQFSKLPLDCVDRNWFGCTAGGNFVEERLLRCCVDGRRVTSVLKLVVAEQLLRGSCESSEIKLRHIVLCPSSLVLGWHGIAPGKVDQLTDRQGS